MIDPLGEEIPRETKNLDSLTAWKPAGTSRVATGGRRAGAGAAAMPPGPFDGPLGGVGPLGGGGPLDGPPRVLSPVVAAPVVAAPVVAAPVVAAPVVTAAKVVPKATPVVAKVDSDDDFDLPDDSAPSKPEPKAHEKELPWLQDKPATTTSTSALVPPGRRQMMDDEKQRKASADKERDLATTQRQREELLSAERARLRKEIEDELRTEMSREQQEKYSLKQQLQNLQDNFSVERVKWESKDREASNDVGRLTRTLEEARSKEERATALAAELQLAVSQQKTAPVPAPSRPIPDNLRAHLDLESEGLDSKLQLTADRITQQVAEAQARHAEMMIGTFREELKQVEEKVLKHRDERLHIEQADRMRLLEEERDVKVRMEREERAEKSRRDERERDERRAHEEGEAARRQDQEREDRNVRLKKDIEERDLWMTQERERSQMGMTQALERLSVQHKLSEEHYLRMSTQQAKEMEARFVSEKIQTGHTHKAQMEAMSQRFQQLQQIQDQQHKKSLEAMSLHAENATSIRETWAVLQKNVEGLAHIRMVFERQEAVFQQERDSFNREREVMMKELTHNLVHQHSAVEREKQQLSNMLTEIQTIFTSQNETLNEERNKLALLMKKGEAQRQMWEREHRQWMTERSAVETERNELLAHVKHAFASFTEERRKLQANREELDGVKERVSQEAATRQDLYERQQVDVDERMHKARSLIEGEYNQIRGAEADLAAREEDFQKRTAQLRGAAMEVQRRAEEAEMGMRAAEQKLEVAERVRESLQKNNNHVINASVAVSSSDDERQRLRRERKELEEERLRLMAQQNERMLQKSHARPTPAQFAAPAAAPDRRVDELDRRIDQVLSMYPTFNAPRSRWDPSMSQGNVAAPAAAARQHHQGMVVSNAAMQTSFSTNVSTSTHDQSRVGLPTSRLTNLVPVHSDHDTTTTSSRYGEHAHGHGHAVMIAPPSSVGKETLPTPSVFTTESS